MFGRIIIIYFSFVCANLFGQCTSTGFRIPSSISENTTIGTISWSSAGDAIGSDNNHAQVSALVLGDVSHYMFASDFGFSLPSTAIICGIEVQIERSTSGVLQDVKDESVRLCKNGSIVGNEFATTLKWPTSDSTISYGGGTNLWGESWNYSDINSAGFGVVVSVSLDGSIALPTASVDNVSISVFYEDVLDVELRSFTASQKSSSVLIEWESKSENNSDYYSLYKSDDGIQWQKIADIPSAGNSVVPNYYEYSDRLKSSKLIYYRLTETNLDGDEMILDELSIQSNQNTVVEIYPNPVVDQYLNIYAAFEIESIIIYDISGKLIIQYLWDEIGPNFIDVSSLEKGSYILKINSIRQTSESVTFVKL